MRYLNFICFVFLVAFSAASVGPAGPSLARPGEPVAYIKIESAAFARAMQRLYGSIKKIDRSDPLTISAVIAELRQTRLQYKKISFFLNYFYPQAGKLYNGPAKKEVEEPFLEYEEPQSLQQIESLLFTPDPARNKVELENLALVLSESAAALNSMYYEFSGKTPQWMESIHLELIRIMTLYITGYDAPDLKMGILESGAALKSMHSVSDLFLPRGEGKHLLDSLFTRATEYTKSADFDHFDRLVFLTQYALPLEVQFNRCIEQNGWQLNTSPGLNYRHGNLFQRELSSLNPDQTEGEINLGRKLFFETALSGNNRRSCASCHQPDKYFTDQLPSNRKLSNDSSLRRNTPTLLYVSCQPAQFWDGRAATLRSQISEVMMNPDEMNGSTGQIIKRLTDSQTYRGLFSDAFSMEKIETALIAYLETLRPMNSPFDRYMSGDQQAMSPAQKKGFNLFMGKAQCGSCHFAPIFNGSIPPFFSRSEYEVLGVPGPSASNPSLPDQDLGRYELYPVSVYKRAFKTPTVRNCAKTAPYMHNGHFKTLDSVLAFYNKGGGAGTGLGTPEQTLPAKPLHLSQRETGNIIAFLESLTDKLKPLILH